MKSFRRSVLANPVWPLLLLSAMAGCQKPLDPEVVAARTKFVLASSPGESRGISWIRKDLVEGTSEDPADVIVLGRINAGEMPPWESGQAAFIVTDVTGHEGEHDHDPHN